MPAFGPASAARNPAQAAALARVRAFTRARFALAEEATVLAAEVACQLPGCPPVETAIAFWSEDGVRHQFKVFKPAAEVTADDLPPAWYRDALVADAFDCGCC